MNIKNKSADGLRGIAALNVAISHFFAAFLPMMLHKNYPTIFASSSNTDSFFTLLTSPFVSTLYNGHFAVFIFFVLSGYVLTLPYYSEINHSKKILLKRLLGRYLRLNIPIIIAVFLSYSVYKLGLYSNIRSAEISGSTNWLKNFFPSDITLLSTIKEGFYQAIFFSKNTLIPPLWTLKIEFLGSIYILLFYILKPKKYFLISSVIALSLIHFIHKEDSIYYFSIFFGSLLYNIKNITKYRLFIFLFGFYFGGFQFNSFIYDYLPNLNFYSFDIWDRKNIYNAVGAVLITLSIVQGFGSKIFENSAAQFLGRISFSIYLLHFIVLCSLSSFVYIHLPQSKLFLFLNFILYLFICFLVSIVFESVIDKKSVRISHAFSSSACELLVAKAYDKLWFSRSFSNIFK
jgi:peptidoglycan/LPS O-acetylase OafA/YrhL